MAALVEVFLVHGHAGIEDRIEPIVVLTLDEATRNFLDLLLVYTRTPSSSACRSCSLSGSVSSASTVPRK